MSDLLVICEDADRFQSPTALTRYFELLRGYDMAVTTVKLVSQVRMLEGLRPSNWDAVVIVGAVSEALANVMARNVAKSPRGVVIRWLP